MALKLKMNRCEVFEVSHWNVKLLKGIVLAVFIKNSNPEKAFSPLSFMGRMVKKLLIPMRMSFFWNYFRKHDVFSFWSYLRVLRPSKLNKTRRHPRIGIWIKRSIYKTSKIHSKSPDEIIIFDRHKMNHRFCNYWLPYLLIKIRSILRFFVLIYNCK